MYYSHGLYWYILIHALLCIADESFVVRPDNSSDMQLIGAKGNMSLIYLSKEGITLALQVCTAL